MDLRNICESYGGDCGQGEKCGEECIVAKRPDILHYRNYQRDLYFDDLEKYCTILEIQMDECQLILDDIIRRIDKINDTINHKKHLLKFSV